MVCASITVAQPRPTLSSLYVESRGGGSVFVQWNQDLEGAVTLKVDNMVISSVVGYARTNTANLTGISSGAHNICVDPV